MAEVRRVLGPVGEAPQAAFLELTPGVLDSVNRARNWLLEAGKQIGPEATAVSLNASVTWAYIEGFDKMTPGLLDVIHRAKVLLDDGQRSVGRPTCAAIEVFIKDVLWLYSDTYDPGLIGGLGGRRYSQDGYIFVPSLPDVGAAPKEVDSISFAVVSSGSVWFIMEPVLHAATYVMSRDVPLSDLFQMPEHLTFEVDWAKVAPPGNYAKIWEALR
jgi:hypothetical protein